jgi:ATP-dependent Clp protease adaptor protein ClpS
MNLPKIPISSTPSRPNQPQNPGDGSNNRPSGDTEGSVDLIDRLETPKMFRVLLINDDFTPMDFVVLVLRRFFAKDEQQATAIMLDVHQKGAGTAGVYILEMAEMKVMQVNQFARMNQHPLKATLEEIP